MKIRRNGIFQNEGSPQNFKLNKNIFFPFRENYHLCANKDYR